MKRYTLNIIYVYSPSLRVCVSRFYIYIHNIQYACSLSEEKSSVLFSVPMKAVICIVEWIHFSLELTMLFLSDGLEKMKFYESRSNPSFCRSFLAKEIGHDS